MPGLSSSTMNLKFMQRAAARTPTSAPSTPGPSTPLQRPSTSTRQHAEGSSSTPRLNDDEAMDEIAPEPVATAEEARLIASEEPYRWTLIRTQPQQSIPKSTAVKFETSYLPFIPNTASDRDSSPDAGPSTRGGGGRMVFGYKEPEQEDLEKDEEGEDGEEDGEDVVIHVREREKGKREHKRQREGRRPIMSEKGFMKPRSRSISPDRSGRKERTDQKSLLPTTSTSRNGESSKAHNKHSNHSDTRTNGDSHRSAQGKEAKYPTQVKLEPNQSQSTTSQSQKSDGKNRKRKPSQSNSTDQARTKFNVNSTGISDKKPKLSPSMLNDYPTQQTQSTQSASGTSAIDDREAVLKAQRKKEKNAKKKARKSAEKA